MDSEADAERLWSIVQNHIEDCVVGSAVSLEELENSLNSAKNTHIYNIEIYEKNQNKFN